MHVFRHDPETDSALLGRSPAYPPGMFTCLSGFVDNCEPLEDAVRREVFEEAGVRVGAVDFVGSQPWAIGRSGTCELMLGCIAEATSTDITLQEEEVEAARWVPRAEVAEAVRVAASASTVADGELWIPGPFAIAHHLIKRWADGSPTTTTTK